MMLDPQLGDIPYAPPTPLSQPFWDGCAQGELRYQYFPASGTHQFPPSPVDRITGSAEFDWRVSGGLGRIYSYTVVWRAQSPAFTVPYAIGIVSLDEGYQMLANIIGCAPTDIVIGMRVGVTFHRVNDELILPYFSPVGLDHG